MMNSKIEGAVLGAFVGDALSLGAHWVYDQAEIETKFGGISGLLPPISNSYHAAKSKGDFTHYGDQALVLLRSVAALKGFDKHHFAENWRESWQGYEGYIDKATNKTLANYKTGRDVDHAASESDDLGGASRMAPLVAAYPEDRAGLRQASQAQAAVTHGHPLVSATAAYLAEAVSNVLEEQPLGEALRSAGEEFTIQELPVSEWISRAGSLLEKDTRAACKELGLSCPLEKALPATLYLAAKHGENFEEALIENVMAGGDSAARGLALGMLLGAAHGKDAIPEKWLREMNATKEIESLLAKLAS